MTPVDWEKKDNIFFGNMTVYQLYNKPKKYSSYMTQYQTALQI